ncbi:3-keto-disaccharide hydrolase [Pirellulaceae bacterium SH449]
MNWGRLIVKTSIVLSVVLVQLSALRAQSENGNHPGGPFDLEQLLSARMTSEELERGWIRLFDGQTLMGWTPTQEANWSVVDGVLQATGGTNSLLCTSVPFTNFEIKLQFRAEERTNSGVFLRTPAVPEDPGRDCFELNIAPLDNPFPTGSLVFRQKRAEAIVDPVAGEWHELRAIVDGPKVETWLNGNKTCEYVDTTDLKSGWIGLQFREGKIEFRDIKLRPFAEEKLIGNQIAFKSPVNVNANYEQNGAMTIAGGRGFVESTFLFGSGVLQITAETLAPNVNSGVFFRCIPGEDMNGYECQIHHGFDGSRLKPLDSGTGAIFRRQAARAVLSDEGELTYVTIIADGPQISTWVQGVQVVEWRDLRKPDSNPRRGLRVDPGTVMLQGHDPDCKVRFHSIKIQ